jgi:anthranilate synthase/aminodeoxychorismate synthase-like glutamine amidotransferase
VLWNDRVEFAAIETMTITHIVISPGPGGPSEAGASEDVMRQFAGRMPILYVCLGHQAIFEVYGGHSRSVGRDHAWEDLCHPPRCTRCLPQESRSISSCSIPLSLVGTVDTLPSCLTVTAKSSNGLIMGVCHKSFRVSRGVQFHPESILSEHGYELLHNSLVDNCVVV